MFRLYCNVDDTLKFELFGSLPTEARFDTRTLFLTNTYLDRILFSVVVPPPFYTFVARHGIIEPAVHGDAVQRLSVLKDPVREAAAEHYRLPSEWSLQLVLRFRPFVNEGDWYPMDEVIERDLLITFQDTHEQVRPPPPFPTQLIRFPSTRFKVSRSPVSTQPILPTILCWTSIVQRSFVAYLIVCKKLLLLFYLQE